MLVIIMRGLPGSGKSTFARQIIKAFNDPLNCRIVSADDYFSVDGEYRFDKSKLHEAHDQCLERFCVVVGNRSSLKLVIVDNTNIHTWEIAPYYRLAEYYGATVKIVTMRTCLEDCLKRQTHGVPEVTMGMMHANLSREVLPPHWKHEYAWSIV